MVIYDDMGGLNAARLFWELERIGHPEVSVLDGGLVAWILKGGKVDNKSVIHPPTNYRLGGGGRANEARLHEVRKASEKGAGQLLDVRNAEEYAGDPKEPRTGHVPRARHWPWDQAVDFAGGFVRRDRQTLLQSFKEAGVGGRKAPIIVYCRSGRRAAQTYLTLRDLGYENVKIYAEFINEYSAASTAPLKQGDEP